MSPTNNSDMDSYYNNEDPSRDEDGNGTINPVRYIYLPFRNNNSIRLLTLFPSSDGPRLRCTLEETEFDYSPDYEAISYVWGDNQRLASIVCDSKGKELGITRNLEAALRRFRLSDKPRCL
jgi:hypothetical protein